MNLKKYIKIDWNIFNSLLNKQASDCFCVGEGYIEFVDGVAKYREVIAMTPGYGDASKSWEQYDVGIE